MDIIWGSILVIFTLVLCWLAQVINAFFPGLAAKLGLNEAEDEVDPTFFADTRGEAIWDTFILWPLPVAGILLLLNNPNWAYFGLMGGGIYLYFAGRGIVVRMLMHKRGIRIGATETVRAYYVFLGLWAALAIITIILSVRALPLP